MSDLSTIKGIQLPDVDFSRGCREGFVMDRKQKIVRQVMKTTRDVRDMRTCSNCLHRDVGSTDRVCQTCVDFGNWESLETATDGRALNTQVGGNHYKKYKIQPIEFFIANDIPYAEAAVIKYVVRHKDKNGKEDLDKAIHLIQILKEQCYPD